MPVRLVAIDIDGTLLDSHWHLPDENRRAIVETMARGVHVALVTGRRFDFARPVFELLPCDVTLIVSNGALVKTRDGRTLVRHLLDRGIAAEALRVADDLREGAGLIFDRPREAQVVFERIDWEHPNRRGYAEQNRDFIAEIAPLEDALTEDPIQVMFNGGVAEMRALAARLRGVEPHGRYTVAVTEYESRKFALVDVLAPGCTKGRTLLEWAHRCGVRREEVMAIGDNLNDREMLEAAGVPVVMGNAVPELLAAGWPVTRSNDSAGVAAALEAIVLEPARRLAASPDPLAARP